MLKQRFITATVSLALLTIAIWFGFPWFSLLVVLAACFGAWEFYGMLSQAGEKPFTFFGLFWIVVLVLSPHSPYQQTTHLLLTLIIVSSLIRLLFHLPRQGAFANWAWTLAGILYIGWFLSYWVNLRVFDEGRSWTFFAILTTLASDVSAFFFGIAFGRRFLAPSISPGKTWEGTVGGFLGTMIVSLTLARLLSLPLAWWQALLLGITISLFAQLGDLVESLLKRNMRVKDSGKLMPGHGGILDRLDSLIFTGAVVYYYVIWLSR